MKIYYIVEHNGMEDSFYNNLTSALIGIGLKLYGNLFGCLNVTVQQAVEAGYKIRMVSI